MALAASAPAAGPPKFDGTTHLTFTLRIQAHGITLRTVRFQRSVPLTAAGFRTFLKHGYWDVGFLGKNEAQSMHMCDLSTFCTDLEPGHELDGAPFNNISVTSPASAQTASRRTFVLDGSMAIGSRASITNVSPDFNLCRSGCSSPGFLIDTPSPIAVAAGQSVLFTIEISLSLKHG